MASKTIGGINVTITATIDKFQKAMTAVQRLTKGAIRHVKDLVFSLKGLAVAFAAGAFVKFTASQFDAIDALGELSDKLGVAPEKLAGLQLAASEAGVSNTLLEKSLVKLSNTMGMSGDKALRKWIADTSKLTTQQEKLAAATKMFGAKGTDMVRFLNGGVGALDEAQEAAVNLGMALDRKTIAGVERAKDAFQRFKTAVSGIFKSLAAEIAPFIEVLSNKATSFLAEGGRGKGIGATIANAIIEMAKFVADAIQKMVGGVLTMAGHIVRFVEQFRSGAPGWLGVGFESTDDALAMDQMGARLLLQGEAFQKTPWSESIEKMAADARAKAAEQAATNSSLKGGLSGFFGKQFGKVSPLLESFGQMGGSAWGGFKAGVQGLPGMMLQAQIDAALFAGRKQWSERNNRGSLTFAESGSAESYRQRAQIKKQSDDTKIFKEQLAAIKELVRIARQGGGGLPAANL